MLAHSAKAMATIDTRLHPLQALRAVRRLLANPEDTRQVFVIVSAMRGRSGVETFRRFRESATGAAVLASRRSLIDALRDTAALARLPPGTLGRVYGDFMHEQNLSADGLAQASESWDDEVLPPDVRMFRERMRDMHDLTHTLTGYGRDPLGELCLLAFMFSHTRNLGAAMIALMGMIRAGRSPKKWAARMAIIQAWRNGRKARWLPEQDWEALLAQPLELLRLQIGVAPPTRYSALRAAQSAS